MVLRLNRNIVSMRRKLSRRPSAGAPFSQVEADLLPILHQGNQRMKQLHLELRS